MPNRRQVLEFGLVASVWPGLTNAAERFSSSSSTPALAEALTRFPLYKAIYDASYAPALAFAAHMRGRGVAVHPIDGDITSLWFNDLALRWREHPVAIAGLTAPEALFCLEQLAWDHRMRVVYREPHTQPLLVSWVIAPVDST
jgi:hypothetical protein